MIEKSFQCVNCRHEWSVAYGAGRPNACPQCNGTNLQRSEKDGVRPGAAAQVAAGAKAAAEGRCHENMYAN